MKTSHSAFRTPALLLFALFGGVALPGIGMAADDAQAEREARRIETEARREQEMGRRDIESRERVQAEALRGQEESIRRMEATQSRMDAVSQQMVQQSAEQARNSGYPNFVYSTPRQPVVPVPAPVSPLYAPVVPEARALSRSSDPVGGINFAPLSERLKSYFGAQSGVLVVSAGAGAPFGLQDGDVIISVDGRAPADGPHAARILRSYQPGERLKLRVQRDRRAIDLDTTAPAIPR